MKLNKWTITAAVLLGLSLAYAKTATNPSCVTFENGTHSMKLCSAANNDVTISVDGAAAKSIIGVKGDKGDTGATGPAGPAATAPQFTSFNCTNLAMSTNGISGAGCTFK